MTSIFERLFRKDAVAADAHVSSASSRRRRRPVHEILAELAESADGVGKAGARHSRADQALVQLVHDTAVALGANTDGTDDQTPSGALDRDSPGSSYLKAEWRADVEVSKTQDDQCLVFGWASVVHKDGSAVVDHQGDFIDVHDLEKAVYAYVEESRDGGEMHRTMGKGQLVESVVMTVEKQQAMGLAVDATHLGWWVGYRFDPDVFAKVKSGQYSMFSIGGSAVRVPQ